MRVLLLVCIAAFVAVASSQTVNIPKFPSALDILAKIKQTGEEENNEDVPLFYADFEDWWDGFFEAYRKVMEHAGLDNIELPLNVSMGFEKEFLGQVYVGKMTLFERFIRGLETMHRTGNSKLYINLYFDDGYDPSHLYFRFTGELGIDAVSIGSNLVVSWMDLVGYPKLEATVSDIKLNFSGRFQSDCTAELESKDITLGKMTVNITDLEGPLGEIVDYLAEVVQVVLKEGLEQVLETGVRWIWEDVGSALKEVSQFCHDEECQKFKRTGDKPTFIPNIEAFQNAMKSKF